MIATRLTTILAVLFGVFSGLAALSVGIYWTGAFRLSAAGGTPPPDQLAVLSLLTIVGLTLAVIYGGAAWTIWHRRKWKLTMILSAAAIFGFPIGTALSIAALVLLTRPSVRASFAD